MITQNMLFADGGVIRKNPSPLGGTWAFRIIKPFATDYSLICERSGILLPDQIGGIVVTNNQSEMYAILAGLQALPFDWQGMVCSDSNVTLGRLFRGDRWKNIPEWMILMFREQKKRLVNWDKITCSLLHGHPSRAELAQGYSNKPGQFPVSIHNVRCDELCSIQARKFLQENGIE